jgi:hypothetical protein|tara:strand:+ start:459 stop:941 length:483 start_codon:yes stop_codon:yes gene_type:complete
MFFRSLKAILLIFLFSCSTPQNNLQLGENFESENILGISSLINNPDNYIDSNVTIKGKIVDVCPMKGCWIELKDFDSDLLIRVKVKDDVIIFPQDSKGYDVIVKGQFTKIEFTEAKAKQWKKHLAEEKGISLLDEDIKLEESDLIEFRVNGSGAKILSYN